MIAKYLYAISATQPTKFSKHNSSARTDYKGVDEDVKRLK